MVLHSRGCGRVARRRIQLTDLLVEPHRGSRKVLFYSRTREAPNPQHPCIAWSVSVTVSNDVMRLTRYAARVPENHVTMENGRSPIIDNQRKDR